MVEQLHQIEFETRTIGPMVLTTPVLQHLGLREIVNRYCPQASQAEMDNGLVAEWVTQSRLSDPTALYDLTGWAERYAIPTLSPQVERAEQLNDDRAGRMLDARNDQRAVIWGDWVANAARYGPGGLASSARRHLCNNLCRSLCGPTFGSRHSAPGTGL